MNELIKRFADIQGITYEEAEEKVGAPTDEEILKKIEQFTLQMINERSKRNLNRAQRRALEKKMGKKKFAEVYGTNQEAADTIADTTKKLGYIDLIQKLRVLNEKNEKENKENGEDATESN